jgi:hypothetical protein
MMRDCVLLDRECAAICRLLASLMASDARFAREACRLCVMICDACGTECQRHAAEHCQECAKACRICADECRRMAAA